MSVSGHTGLWLARKTADINLLPGSSARPFSSNVPQKLCRSGCAGALLLEGQFTSEDSTQVFYSLDCTLEYSRNSVLLSFVFPVCISVSATQYVLYKHALNVWKPSNVRGEIYVATGEEFTRFSNTSHRAKYWRIKIWVFRSSLCIEGSSLLFVNPKAWKRKGNGKLPRDPLWRPRSEAPLSLPPCSSVHWPHSLPPETPCKA